MNCFIASMVRNKNERTKTKFRNAVSIKIKNILGASAIRATLLIALIASIGVSFYPMIFQLFVDENTVVSSNIKLQLEQDENIEILPSEQKGKNTDIDIVYQEERYNITVNTQKGKTAATYLQTVFMQNNLEQFVQRKDLTQEEINLLSGENIEVFYDEDISDMEDSVATFIMLLTIIFFLVMTLLVTRIGVQVAAEKGNKVTETILTSITRKQLYYSQIISSIVVVMLSFVIVSIPMIIAYYIKDKSKVCDFSFFAGDGIVTFLVYLILVAGSLVVLAIAVGSSVKHVEDANVMTIFVLLPVLVSYIYFAYNLDVFKGNYAFLNYVPLISTFPVFGGILCGTFHLAQAIGFCGISSIFLVMVILGAEKIYCKNI